MEGGIAILNGTESEREGWREGGRSSLLIPSAQSRLVWRYRGGVSESSSQSVREGGRD